MMSTARLPASSATVCRRGTPRAVLLVLWLAIAGLLAACSTGATQVESGDTRFTTTTQADDAVADDVDGPMIASYVPGSTALVVEIDEIESFATQADLETLQRDFPEVQTLLGGFATQTFGRDIIDVAALRDVGVDVSGPIGLAIVDPEAHEIAVFYARVADADAIMAAARDFATARGATSRIESVAETGATIMALSGGQPLARGWLVLRDDLVMTIVTPASDDLAWEHARFLAGVNTTRSLATASSFTRSHTGLASGSHFDAPDVRLFYNLGAVTQRVVATMEDGADDDYATEQLRHARAQGNREDIEYWEQQVRQNAEWRARSQARTRAWRQLLTRAIAPITGVALQIDVDGGALDVRGYAAVPGEGTLPRDLLTNATATPPIVHAETTPAMVMLYMHAEHDEALEVLEMILRLDGPDAPAQARAFLTDNLGIDLDADLLPLLTGELGGRVHVARDDEGNFIEDESAVRFTIAAGVNDRAAMIATLEKVFAQPLVAVLARRVTHADARWRINVPFYTTLWIDVLDDQLVVSTAEDASQRIATRAALPTGAGAPPAAVNALLEQSDLAGLMAYNHELLISLFSIGSWSSQEVWDDPAPGVPMSAASEAKRAELDARHATRDAEVAELDKERRAHQQAMIDALGTTALNARVSGEGLALNGRYAFGTASVAEMLGIVVTSSRALDDVQQRTWDTQNAFYDDIYRLREELRVLREQDAVSQP